MEGLLEGQPLGDLVGSLEGGNVDRNSVVVFPDSLWNCTQFDDGKCLLRSQSCLGLAYCGTVAAADVLLGQDNCGAGVTEATAKTEPYCLYDCCGDAFGSGACSVDDSTIGEV